MKTSKRIFSRIPLILPPIVLMIGYLLTSPVMAEGGLNEEAAPYQSSFEGYKPLTDENIADWKKLNQQAATSEKSMPGMSENSDMANMPGMDMDKPSAKAGSSDMSSMKGMDHSKMQGMQMEKSTAKPNNSDMANMPGMDMSKSSAKAGGSDMADMPGMNMSKSDTKSGNADMSNMQDTTSASKTDSSDMSSMAGMDHSKMKTMSAESASNDQGFQIIPNFHPIVVHFPIALTFIAFLLSIAAYARRSHPVSAQLAAAGHFTLWLAAIGAAAAVLFGWLAFNSISNHDDAGHAAMLLHRSWAIPTALGLILLAGWDAWKNRINELISVPMLFLLLLLSQAIAVTGWLGGEVVYRHGIGVLSIPSSNSGGHGHNAKPVSVKSVEKNVDIEGESHAH